MNRDELRRKLDHWANTEPRPDLSVLPADCACECAASPKGSYGRVADEEILLYFVTSRYSIDLKNKKTNVRENSLKNVFDRGLSVIRLVYCNDEELNGSAFEVARGRKTQDGEFGGIATVISVPCLAIRNVPDGKWFCVYETPADPKEDGGFGRPSHADIASSAIILEEDDKTARRAKLYNILIQGGEESSIFDFRDGLLAEHAPDHLKQQRAAR